MSDDTRALRSPRRQTGKYLLRLGGGSTPKSITGYRNLERACEEYLADRYPVEAIDLLKNSHLSKNGPTILRKLPVPIRKVIGDISDSEQVRVALDLGSNENNAFASRNK